MNTKTIKAIRWHKKSMIDVMKAEGIDVHEIDITLDNIIENLDEKRRDEDPIEKARAEGYEDGHIHGRLNGYSEGWYNAKKQYENRDSQDHDRHNPRIIIMERSISGSTYYNVYVDGEYIGYRWSENVAIKMGERYIVGME